jgi:hypothetical protein
MSRQRDCRLLDEKLRSRLAVNADEAPWREYEPSETHEKFRRTLERRHTLVGCSQPVHTDCS